MIGLGLMAMRLAHARAYPQYPSGSTNQFGALGVPRVMARCDCNELNTPGSCEYYRIIDRLSRGEAP